MLREIRANQGPTMKRWKARAQGRAFMILKRSSHIEVVLKEKEEANAVAEADKTADKKEEK